MRPLRLSMTAFGPFVQTEVIDFEQLGDKPLFLINGATGSGKTTILDAICFALYGQTTGKEREAVEMRCDYANDQLLTEVELVFELAGQQYRIKRIPEQFRAKVRGEGATRQAASAELARLKPDGEKLLVARKVSAATAMIEELTGLQVDQFRQVMVLPQGQFRRLLMADSRDREQIFSQLFATHIYKRIEDKLKEQAKEVYIQVARLQENQQGILQSAGFETLKELETAIAQQLPQCEQAKKEADDKNALYLQQVREQNTATALDKEFGELESRRQQLKRLDKQKSTIESYRKKVELAAQAQKLKPAFNELKRSNAAVAASNSQLKEAQDRLGQVQKQFAEAEKNLAKNESHEQKLEQLKQQLLKLQDYQQRLDKLQHVQQQFEKLQQQFNSSGKKLKTCEQKLNTDKEKLQQEETQKASLEKSLRENSEAPVQHEKTAQRYQQRQQLVKLEQQQSRLSNELKKVTAQGKALAQEHKKYEQQTKGLELAWHHGQAAILARELAQDQPCPVCGSLDHPSPAQTGAELPTDQQREAAAQAVVDAEQKVQAAREQYQRKDSELKSLNQQIADLKHTLGPIAERSLQQLQGQLQALQKQVQQQQLQQKQLIELDRQLVSLRKQTRESEQQREQLMQSHAGLNAEMQKSDALLQEARKEIPKAHQEAGKLHADLKSCETEIQRLGQTIKANLQQHATSSKQLTEAQTQLKALQCNLDSANREQQVAEKLWHDSLKQSCFDRQQDYEQALLDDAEVQGLEKTISGYDKQRQQAKGAFKQQQEKLQGKVKPDLAALQKLLDVAQQAKASADAQWKKLDTELAHLHKASKALKQLGQSQQKAEADYKVVGTLANAASGQSGNKISLQRFVLSVLLDDVLIEASQRLKLMSKGRYLLLRKESRAKGNKASGLELEIEDSYTGKVRPVSTLSGGESFMASLALALGLSDVVQAYAGGIRLDTLFIDEGFGSLDADALDLAIRTLIDLRATGRMVGIISHVSELKEQIPLRLDVITGRHGSTIALVN